MFLITSLLLNVEALQNSCTYSHLFSRRAIFPLILHKAHASAGVVYTHPLALALLKNNISAFAAAYICACDQRDNAEPHSLARSLIHSHTHTHTKVIVTGCGRGAFVLLMLLFARAARGPECVCQDSILFSGRAVVNNLPLICKLFSAP